MKQQLNGIDERLLTTILVELEKRKKQLAASDPGKQPETLAKQSPKKETNEKPPTAQAPKEPKQKPAMTFAVGEVTTRVWANQDFLGEITWRVDQRRKRSDGVGGASCKTMRRENLQDAIRGLYKAQCWIKKTERRLRWRRLFL